MKSGYLSGRVFDGAAAIVTGAASGIGRGLAEELAARGCDVVLADLQIELAQTVASGICANGGNATAAEVDVTDFSAVEAIIHTTIERTGRLDYMFNNAGIGIIEAAAQHQLEDWYRLFDVNVRGIIHGVQAAYQVMLQQGFGHIVNTASVAGLSPFPGGVGYAATKYAVVGLSKSLRIEAALSGIRVSVICPGLIRTPIMHGGEFGRLGANLPCDQVLQHLEKLRPMDPARFARKVLNAVAKNKAVIVVPGWWKLWWWFERLSPSLDLFLLQKFFENMGKKFGDPHKPTTTD